MNADLRSKQLNGPSQLVLQRCRKTACIPQGSVITAGLLSGHLLLTSLAGQVLQRGSSETSEALQQCLQGEGSKSQCMDGQPNLCFTARKKMHAYTTHMQTPIWQSYGRSKPLSLAASRIVCPSSTSRTSVPPLRVLSSTLCA